MPPCKSVYILWLHLATVKLNSHNRDHIFSKAKNIYDLDFCRKKSLLISKADRFKYTHESLFQLDISYFLFREDYLSLLGFLKNMDSMD